jgi:hypothetical protein
MSVTKDSFRDWKANPVTKAVFVELSERIQNIRADLGNTAGLDPIGDRYRAGAIQAYMDILNIDFDEVKNGD